jgi:heat shock protein 90kDa beta
LKIFLNGDFFIDSKRSELYSWEQYIWESDAASFTKVKDPHGDTNLFAQDLFEASDQKILSVDNYLHVVIYMRTSKNVEEVVVVDEPVTEKLKTQEENDEARVKDEGEAEKAPKTKKVPKTVYDWELMNNSKPIWTRKSSDVTQDE